MKVIAIIDIPKTLEAITLIIKIVGNSRRWENYLEKWVETSNTIGIKGDSVDSTDYSYLLKDTQISKTVRILTYTEFIHHYINNKTKEH